MIGSRGRAGGFGLAVTAPSDTIGISRVPEALLEDWLALSGGCVGTGDWLRRGTAAGELVPGVEISFAGSSRLCVESPPRVK